MIWINTIDDLDYYLTPQGAPCYCEQLVYPDDLALQAIFSSTDISGAAITISVLSADGLTVYEDATSYFDYYFFIYNGQGYCNIKLKSFSPAMCLYKCWILRVVITSGAKTLFYKYTQRYCQTSCCDVPRGIVFTTDSVTDPTGAAAETLTVVPATECGAPLLRISVTFDCVDKQLGEYYGIPSGQTWGFTKVVNIAGKIKQRIREITRNISYNCNLQRSESFIPYRLYTQFTEGTFPAWKLKELESMFHARWISATDFINSYTFQFDGGVIAKTVGEQVCWNLFQLDVTLRTCYIRQIFGCDPGCDGELHSLTFLIPEDYGGGNYFNEGKVELGGYSHLLDWYRSQGYVTEVVDVTDQYENIFAAFKVTGTGYIPTQFYYDTPYPKNRVFGVSSPVSPVVTCIKPVIGTILITPLVCAVPTIGSIIVTPITVETADIVSYENWIITDGDSEVILSDTYALLSIHSTNSTIFDADPDMVQLVNEIIGIITPGGRPATPQSIQVTDDAIMTIDVNGVVRWTGPPTSVTATESEVIAQGIYYNLT